MVGCQLICISASNVSEFCRDAQQGQCLLQVGASNELPESEELDALYDRFLLRRQVRQVSTAGLSELLADPEMVDVATGRLLMMLYIYLYIYIYMCILITQ